MRSLGKETRIRQKSLTRLDCGRLMFVDHYIKTKSPVIRAVYTCEFVRRGRRRIRSNTGTNNILINNYYSTIYNDAWWRITSRFWRVPECRCDAVNLIFRLRRCVVYSSSAYHNYYIILLLLLLLLVFVLSSKLRPRADGTGGVESIVRPAALSVLLVIGRSLELRSSGRAVDPNLRKVSVATVLIESARVPA